MKYPRSISCYAAMAATLLATFIHAQPAAAQQPPAPEGNIVTPQLDPPVPPGAMDELIARMAARRAAQQAGQPVPGSAAGTVNPGRDGFEPVAVENVTPPPGPPPAPLPQVAPNSDLRFNYENVPVDTILRDVSRAYGFIIVSNMSLQQRVTIRVDTPVKADDAIAILNAMLYTQGYGTLKSMSNDTAQAKVILRIAPLAEMKKAQIPVFTGNDPAKIPLNDTLITQVIPIKNVPAGALLNDLRPLLSADADCTANASSNCIILTDTSAKIHRMAEIIDAVDKVATDRPALPAGRGTGGGRGPVQPSIPAP
jgi:hypothetical protein